MSPDWGFPEIEPGHSVGSRTRPALWHPTPLSSSFGAFVEAIHRVLAYGAVALVVVGIGWSALVVGRGQQRAGRFEQFQAGLVSLLIVASASGGIMFISGSRPSELLHLLYAGIAIVVIPIARSFLGRASSRRAGLIVLAAFAGLGAVLYRLFTTG